MKALIALAAACLTLAFAAMPAAARWVHQPETGAPRLVLEIPDTWSSFYDTTGSLIVSNPERSVAFSMTVTTHDGHSLDAVVTAAAAGANGSVQRVSDATVAGLPGARYQGTAPGANGAVFTLEMTAALVGQNHIVIIAQFTKPSASQQILDVAALVAPTARIELQ